MPTATPTPVAATPTPVAKPSFMLRSKLLFKKYQNVNGKGMNEIDAENAARSEFGLPPMSEAEIAKVQKRDSFIDKVTHNKVVTAIGSSAAFQKLKAKVEGQPAAAATPTAQPAAAPAVSQPIPTVVATPVAATPTPAATPAAPASQPKA
ncbi:MAG: hypothetical protein WC304_04365 [Candidatus Gracilibacteria bacterium]